MNKVKIPVSVIIPVFNSENYLEKLILEIIEHVEEIIICDSFSTDNTIQIAKKYNLKVIQKEYINSATQKNWAIPQAKEDWVWIIDSDETPEKKLIQEISSFLKSPNPKIHMVYIPRKNLFWGKFMGKASAYPDYQSRLFRKSTGRYQNKEVHAQVEVLGDHIYFKNALIHDDFKDINTWWNRNARYFKYELDECIKNNIKWSLKLQLIKPLYVFFKFYILRNGYRHGFIGFLNSFLWFVYYFMVAAKLYEYNYTK